MVGLPTGTVTFLFTDIEGSTRLLQQLGERYADTLADHRRLLRAAFEAHNGCEVDTQGDAFFAAFSHAGTRSGGPMLTDHSTRAHFASESEGGAAYREAFERNEPLSVTAM